MAELHDGAIITSLDPTKNSIWWLETGSTTANQWKRYNIKCVVSSTLNRNEITTAIPILQRLSYQLKLLSVLSEATSSQKTQIVAPIW